MFNYKKYVLLVTTFFISLLAIAQDSSAASTNNDGFMRSEGKIYVVMAVVITILAGLLVYMVRLDRKITKLEKGKYN